MIQKDIVSKVHFDNVSIHDIKDHTELMQKHGPITSMEQHSIYMTT